MYTRNSKYSKNNKFNNDCKLTQKYAIRYRKNKQIKRKLRFITKKGKEGRLEVRKFRESTKNFSCYQKTDVKKYRENN